MRSRDEIIDLVREQALWSYKLGKIGQIDKESIEAEAERILTADEFWMAVETHALEDVLFSI